MKSKARNNGKLFEARINAQSQTQGIYCLKIPESVRFIRSKNISIQTKTPFDFTACVDGMAVYFDAKFETSKALYFSELFNDKKIHQWLNLQRVCDDAGAMAGYLIHFEQHQQIVWASVEAIRDLISRGAKAIAPSPDLPSQSDNKWLNLRRLLRYDLEKRAFSDKRIE